MESVWLLICMCMQERFHQKYMDSFLRASICVGKGRMKKKIIQSLNSDVRILCELLFLFMADFIALPNSCK